MPTMNLILAGSSVSSKLSSLKTCLVFISASSKTGKDWLPNYSAPKTSFTLESLINDLFMVKKINVL